MALLREETPVYKMARKGSNYLADVELLAMLLGGNPDKAAEQARKIMEAVGGLRGLGKMLVSDLCALGCTERQAATVMAAVHIGIRRSLSVIDDRPRIASSRDAFNCIAALLADLPHEEFWILLLNRANEVTDRVRVSVGGINGTVADMKVIFREAVLRRASGVIFVHNHPSGNLQPSSADVDLTRKGKEAGKALEVTLLDHLIISERGYYSFADEGII